MNSSKRTKALLDSVKEVTEKAAADVLMRRVPPCVGHAYQEEDDMDDKSMTHYFFSLMDFAEEYKKNPEQTLEDLNEYFKVKLYADKCGCESSGVGVCCRTEQRSSSNERDNK